MSNRTPNSKSPASRAKSPASASKARAAAAKKPKLRSAAASKVRRGNETFTAASKAKASAAVTSASPTQAQRRRRAPARKKQAGGFQKFMKKFCGAPPRVEINRRTEELARMAHVSAKELRRLRAAFDAVDLDGASSIDFEEFFESVNEQRTPFTDFVFTLLNDPRSTVNQLSIEEQDEIARETGAPPLRVTGSISFDDYVQLVLTYCTLSKDDMLQFCFVCFDKDKSGVIDENEFVELCATVNNMNPTYPGNFKSAMEQFDRNDDGMIDFDEFKTLDRRYPMILFPVFKLQDALQKGTLGEDRWTQIARRIAKHKMAEEYKRTHGGREPPKTCWEKFTGCFSSEGDLTGVIVTGGESSSKGNRKRKK